MVCIQQCSGRLAAGSLSSNHLVRTSSLLSLSRPSEWSTFGVSIEEQRGIINYFMGLLFQRTIDQAGCLLSDEEKEGGECSGFRMASGSQGQVSKSYCTDCCW